MVMLFFKDGDMRNKQDGDQVWISRVMKQKSRGHKNTPCRKSSLGHRSLYG